MKNIILIFNILLKFCVDRLITTFDLSVLTVILFDCRSGFVHLDHLSGLVVAIVDLGQLFQSWPRTTRLNS